MACIDENSNPNPIDIDSPDSGAYAVATISGRIFDLEALVGRDPNDTATNSDAITGAEVFLLDNPSIISPRSTAPRGEYRLDGVPIGSKQVIVVSIPRPNPTGTEENTVTSESETLTTSPEIVTTIRSTPFIVSENTHDLDLFAIRKNSTLLSQAASDGMDYTTTGLHVGLIVSKQQSAVTGATIDTLPKVPQYAIDRSGTNLVGFDYSLTEDGPTHEFGGFLVNSNSAKTAVIAIQGAKGNTVFDPLTVLLAPNQVSYGIHQVN